MQYLVSVSLFVVGLIHLLPAYGVLGSNQLSKLYDVNVDDPNLQILMRHRAVLFGLLGCFLIGAAFIPSLQGLAFGSAFVSVISYLYLVWSVDGYNQKLKKVFYIDVVALGMLVVGCWAFL
ncbi:phosphopantetheine adenylyltransferase [Moraxellaceae bacterium AER2_44_116]|nr:phosphopantetheine adenylyltransferase [Moraxellaceae bacterium]TQC98757.1 phosphopantetheine adenylyltransferase [Moraxellaceae bacterium AER2_44_116]